MSSLFRLSISLLPILMVTSSAVAQVTDRPTIGLEAAQIIMAAAVQEAKRLDAPGGSIAIVDDGGHLVLFYRLDGTMPATPPIAEGKARTAALFRAPTAKFEKIVMDGRTPMLAVEGFIPMQGGVPIIVDGFVIGGIGVAGAASAPQDVEIANAGARTAAGLRR